MFLPLSNRIAACNLVTANSSYLLFWEITIQFWEGNHTKPGFSEHF